MIMKANDLDILLAMNRSFAEYDRERKFHELESEHRDKENAEPRKTTALKWETRDFNREALLAKAKQMEGAKVLLRRT